MPFLTVIIVVGLTEAKSLTGGKGLAFSPVIGGFILGLVLFGLDAVNTQLTRTFCTLIIVTALLYNGSSIASSLSPRATTGKTSALGGGGRPNSVK